VRVADNAGITISSYAVSFSTTGGTLNPTTATTDAQGRARTLLTLPGQPGQVTVTASAQGLPSVTFTARVLAPAMSITTAYLPAARSGVSYVRALSASGGAPGATFSYSVTSGGLPPGLTLGSDGSITGTATAAGAYPLTVRVSDGQASEASQQFTLNVCEPTGQPMAVGEVRVLQVSDRGSCGIFLPSGTAGARYRITAARTGNQENGADLSRVSFVVSGNGITGSVAAAAARAPLSFRSRPVDVPGLARQWARLEAHRRSHLRALQEGEALAASLGTRSLAGGVTPQLPAPLAAVDLPDKIRITAGTPTACNSASTQATAIRLAQNDWLAVYQDSAQNSILSTQVSPADAGRLIELGSTYGKPVIDAYFGGVPDLDANGKVIVVVSPAMGESLGKVWTGNFYRKADCAPSNEGEYVYLHWETVKGIEGAALHFGHYVLVHELKHVSSLYRRILRAGSGVVDPRRAVDYNPLWMEEGGAELASEMAGRLAWSQLGGPASNVRATEQHFRIQSGAPLPPCRDATNSAAICTANFPVLAMLFGAQEHLSVQPNSIVARPPGTPSSYVYSSGWLFQRWLGDAYGGAASGPLGDADFFEQLNDPATPSGVLGVETMTGKTWVQLMEEFSVAAMGHGRVPVPRTFTGYDFLSAIEMWCFAVDPADFTASQCTGEAGPPGAFPWPVTTDEQGVSESRSFADLLLQGDAGPSGIRVHDLLSNGTGQGAEVNVELSGASLVRVLRIR
jgi:hypothetical protein